MRDGRSPLHGRLGKVLRHDTHRPPRQHGPDAPSTGAHSAHRPHGLLGAARHSVPWSRLAMAQPRGQYCSGIPKLKQLARIFPWVYPYQWVDDINLIAIGTQRLIEIHSPNATLELLTGLRNKGLGISTKSQIMAPRPVLAKRLASLLELEGEQLKVATVGKDLGIDFAKGRTVVSTTTDAHARRFNGFAASASSRNTSFPPLR